MNARTTSIQSGKCFYKIAMQILTPEKKLCCMRPMVRNPTAGDRYKVSLWLTQKMDSSGTFVDMQTPFSFGETSDYWRYDTTLQKDVKCSPWEDTKKYGDAALGMFGARNRSNNSGSDPSLQFNEAGTYKLCANVLDGDVIILSEVVTIAVKAEDIDSFELSVPLTSQGDEPMSLCYPVGHMLPTMTLSFKDKAGRPFLFNDSVHALIRIESDQMEVKVKHLNASQSGYEYVSNPIYKLCEETDPGGVFTVEEFVPEPKNGRAFMSTDSLTEEFHVEYKISVWINPDGDVGLDSEQIQDPTKYTKSLGTKQSFRIVYHPAEVSQLKLLSNNDIHVINGEMVPNIEFACLDKWGHRTKPFGHNTQKWVVHLNKNPYIRGLLAKDEKAIVQSSGLVTFSHLMADADIDLPVSGLQVKAEFKLEITQADGTVKCIPTQKPKSKKKKKDKNDLDVELDAPSAAAVDILIEGPQDIPAALEVYHDGTCITKILQYAAGSVINGLTLSVLDARGNRIETLREEWLKGKGCGVFLRSDHGDESKEWTFKANISKPLEHEGGGIFALPDIHLPKAVKAYDFEVCLKIGGGKRTVKNVDPFAFQIRAQSGSAVKWEILGNFDEGVKIGEWQDLQKKLQAIVLVDAGGNHVSWKKDLHPAPKLSFFWSLERREEDLDVLNSRKRKMIETSAATRKVLRSDEAGSSWLSAVDDAVEELHICDSVVELDLEIGVMSINNDVRTFAPLTSVDVDQEQFVCYILCPQKRQSITLPQSQEYPPSPPIVCWLKAADQPETAKQLISMDISESVRQFNVSSGPVRQVYFACEALGVPDYVTSSVIDVDRLTDEQISVHLTDASGVWLGSIDKDKTKKVIFCIQCEDTETRLYSSKQITSAKFTVPIKVADMLRKLDQTAFEDDSCVINLGLFFSVSEKGNEMFKSNVAKLHCRLQKLNAVKQLKIDLIPPLSKLLCSEALPSIRVSATTERGTKYTPSIASLKMNLEIHCLEPNFSKDAHRSQRISSQSSVTSVSFSDLFCDPIRVEQSEDATNCGFVEFAPRTAMQDLTSGKRKRSQHDAREAETAAHSHTVGNYSIIAHFEEERKGLSRAKGLESIITECINFEVQPHNPVELQILDPILFENALAGNFITGSVHSRQLSHSEVRIVCIDEFDNRSYFPSDCVVRAHIQRMGPDQMELPELEESVNGFLNAVPEYSVSGDLHAFVFRKLQFVPGVGSRAHEKLSIVFTCQTVGNTNDIKETSAAFEFVTDASRAERHKELQDRLEPLQRKVSDYNQEKNELLSMKTATLHQLKINIDAFKKPLANRLTLLYTVLAPPDALESKRLQDVRKELSNNLHQIINVTQVRAPIKDKNKIPNQAALNDVSDCLGLTVDLGFVDDERLAKICSYAAGDYMGAVICPNDASALALYKKNIKSWSMTRMQTFNGQYGNRKEEDVKQQQLPLPRVDHPGNPRYLVNLIQLDAKSEYLRDNLFFAIFGTTLLFDDADTALSYQKYCLAQRTRPPTVLTMQGDKFRPDGFLNPSHRMPERLPFVFGEQPPNSKSDFHSCENQLATIDGLLSLCDERDKVEYELHKLEGMEDEIETNNMQILEIKTRMEELRLLGK